MRASPCLVKPVQRVVCFAAWALLCVCGRSSAADIYTQLTPAATWSNTIGDVEYNNEGLLSALAIVLDSAKPSGNRCLSGVYLGSSSELASAQVSGRIAGAATVSVLDGVHSFADIHNLASFVHDHTVYLFPKRFEIRLACLTGRIVDHDTGVPVTDVDMFAIHGARSRHGRYEWFLLGCD